jgi:hypothetical protein
MSCGELEPEVGIDAWNLAGPLHDISMHQHSLGCPLLSAIVVRWGTKYPSNGFYTMAIEDAKLLAPGSRQKEKEAFALAEQQRVFMWWREHPDAE